MDEVCIYTIGSCSISYKWPKNKVTRWVHYYSREQKTFRLTSIRLCLDPYSKHDMQGHCLYISVLTCDFVITISINVFRPRTQFKRFDHHFPENSLVGAQNYCRKPKGKGLGCYIGDTWKPCGKNIPRCDVTCKTLHPFLSHFWYVSWAPLYNDLPANPHPPFLSQQLKA